MLSSLGLPSRTDSLPASECEHGGWFKVVRSVERERGNKRPSVFLIALTHTLFGTSDRNSTAASSLSGLGQKCGSGCCNYSWQAEVNSVDVIFSSGGLLYLKGKEWASAYSGSSPSEASFETYWQKNPVKDIVYKILWEAETSMQVYFSSGLVLTWGSVKSSICLSSILLDVHKYFFFMINKFKIFI